MKVYPSDAESIFTLAGTEYYRTVFEAGHS